MKTSIHQQAAVKAGFSTLREVGGSKDGWRYFSAGSLSKVFDSEEEAWQGCVKENELLLPEAPRGTKVAELIEWLHTLPLDASVVVLDTEFGVLVPVVGVVCDYTKMTVRISLKED